eukprot:1789882-Pyramimonas_sp.AAC.1
MHERKLSGATEQWATCQSGAGVFWRRCAVLLVPASRALPPGVPGRSAMQGMGRLAVPSPGRCCTARSVACGVVLRRSAA